MEGPAYRGGSGDGGHQRFFPLKTDAIQTLMDRLLPLAELVTPNIPEAQMLSGMDIHDERTWKQQQRSSAIPLAVPCC